MGQALAKAILALVPNDYEIVIRTSKQLEHLLEVEWGASGRGLHEKLNCVQASRDPLPEDLVRNMRRLATIRNKLIHEVDFHRIPDRSAFLSNFKESERRLRQILQSRRKDQACAVM